MIVHTNMADKVTNDHEEHEQPSQAPPPYDVAMSNVTSSGPFVAQSANKGQDVKVPAQSPGSAAGPPPQFPSMPSTTVYNYVNPVTHEHIVSLLPPDHPQMICLQQGGHVPHSHFGLLGILAAIFWFPLGVGLCLLDRRVYCERCGAILEEGVCG